MTLTAAYRILTLCTLLCLSASLSAQWQFLGPQHITPSKSLDHALALSPAGQPFMAHIDDSLAARPFVLSYQNGNWADVQSSSLPAGAYGDCELAFDASGRATLALGPQLQVLQWDTVGWSPIGSLPVVTNAQDLILRTAPSGRIVLAWKEPGSPDSTHVYNYSGAWTALGTLAGNALDMELDEFGHPILLMQDSTALIQYTGNQWVELPAFTTPQEDYFSFVLNFDGTGLLPMVARRDSALVVTIEKLMDTTWSDVGTLPLITADQGHLNLSKSGIPHFFFVNTVTATLPSVIEYDSGNWSEVGNQALINNTASLPWIHFTSTARLILFRDNEEGFRSSVMVFGTLITAEDLLEKENIHAQLFPNPNSGKCQLRLEHPRKISQIQLCDLQGRVRWAKAGNWGHQHDIDTRNLPAGIYFLRFEIDHRWHSQRMVIH